MRKLLTRMALLVGMNAALATVLIRAADGIQATRARPETTALAAMPADEESQYLLVGSSHVQVLRLCGESFSVVREALGDDTHIVAKPGSGVFQHSLYLREYYRRGNSADTILYFADPWSFYSNFWNEGMKTEIDREPMDWSFALDMVRSGARLDSAYAYVTSKLRYTAFTQGKHPTWDCSVQLVNYDVRLAALRTKNLYPDGVNPTVMEFYVTQLEKLIAFTRSKGADFVVIIPPTLLGEEPGFPGFRKRLARLEQDRGVYVIDCSNAMTDPAWFSDYDHLNIEGARHFFADVLLPELTALGVARPAASPVH